MKRLAGFSAAPLIAGSTTVVTQSRELGVHLPKKDIWLKGFDINRAYNEFRDLSGKVPDHNFEEFRAMYWRIDESARRAEKVLQDQGHFYLPTLDFGIYKGCAPLFSAKQMRLHYAAHHRAYVERLNKLIVGTPYDKQPLDFIIRATANDDAYKAIHNNACQHYNHMFFWKTIHPWGSNMPPDLHDKIVEQYGSIEKLKDAIKAAGSAHFGSGWLYWVYDSALEKFDILTMPAAGCPLTLDGVSPLLAVDLWEHTWYVDYENEKMKYLEKFFDVVDWHWAERHWKRATNQHYDEMIWV